MKAEDLIIGDWVMFLAEKPFPVKIVAIDSILNCARHSKSYCHYSLDCFEPVFVSPEILINNGFVEEKNDSWSCKKYDAQTKNMLYIITFDVSKGFLNISTKNYDYGTCANEVFYLHEFQHALKLAKINKIFEL